MKRSVKFILFAFSILLMLASCDFTKNHSPCRKSPLTFKVAISSNTNRTTDTVLFTGNDIKSINGTTGEIRFVDSLINLKIKSFHRIKCYLGTDFLFSSTITLPVVSSLINDLVLNLDRNDGHYYFKDGYPDWINNPDINIIRIQHRGKRAVAWSRFIGELKKEGKYIR